VSVEPAAACHPPFAMVWAATALTEACSRSSCCAVTVTAAVTAARRPAAEPSSVWPLVSALRCCRVAATSPGSGGHDGDAEQCLG
jgi:hypothetical protein